MLLNFSDRTRPFDNPLSKTVLESRVGTKLLPSRNPFETTLSKTVLESHLTTLHTGLGDATPQQHGLNKCFKQCFKQRGSDRDRGSHDFIKHL